MYLILLLIILITHLQKVTAIYPSSSKLGEWHRIGPFNR